MKNSKGITLTMLVIMIILLIIIAGISVYTALSFSSDVRIGRILANMELIKSKVEIIYEEFQFSNEDITVGTRVENVDEIKNISNISEADKSILNEDRTWYKWDSGTLEDQNLTTDMLDNQDAYFLVDYESSEIIYSAGTVIDGTSYFSKTALEKVLAREE